MAPTLLAVLAHPDDEVFSLGGSLARYAEEGVEVHLICATRGESGKITAPEIPQDSDRAALREQELRRACEALGIHPPILLDFHDSGRFERTRHGDPKALLNVDEFELEAQLMPHIAALRPQVMITFDPHGFYGHIDHLKVHRAATAAFWSAGAVVAPAPRRLFYTTGLSEIMARRQERTRDDNRTQLDPKVYGVSEDSLAAVLDIRAQAEKKRRAIEAHRSQLEPARRIVEGFERETYSREIFTLGGLRGGFPEPPVADLFAGIR